MLDCGTFWMRENFDRRPPVEAPLPPDAAKTDRDPEGTYPHTLASANFVVKWGDDGAVDEDDVAALLDSFETAWAAEITGMGMPAPSGTETYLFNVYIGDTGDGTPDSYGAGGYYNRDRQGYPFIVIARDSLNQAEYVEGTAAHEFFHSLQDETRSYDYVGAGAWYWEATADWVMAEVFPENASYYEFLFGYALLPELPLGFFDYPDEGTLQEYHQYGAFIFPRFVSEIAGDASVVVASWTDPVSDDPIDTLAAGLSVPFADAFAEFAARNATWDYADGDAYAAHVQQYSGWYDIDPVVDVVGPDGTDGWLDAPADTIPQRYGYNVVKVRDAAHARISVEGDAEGSEGTTADWRFVVVTLDGDTPVRTTVTDGELEIESDGDAWIVAAAVPERSRDEETFAWRYDVEPVVDEPADTGGPPLADTGGDESETAPGCGCDQGGGGAGFAGLALAALAIRRRR